MIVAKAARRVLEGYTQLHLAIDDRYLAHTAQLIIIVIIIPPDSPVVCVV